MTGVTLASHCHGKNRVRVMVVDRSRGDRHRVLEMSVRVTVLSESAPAYTDGDNSAVVPTDTIKNTVNAAAKSFTKFTTADAFAFVLADLFLSSYAVISEVRIEIDVKPWDRVNVNGKPHSHGFTRMTDHYDTVDLVATRSSVKLKSGLKDLIVLKTTMSGFEGFAKCSRTTLPEVSDRLLATCVSAQWTYVPTESLRELEFGKIRALVHDTLMKEFFGDPSKGGAYSPSVQKTLYDMGAAVVKSCKEVASVTLSMPNIHYIPMNLAPIGLKFNNDVYLPTDEPHGMISATIVRSKLPSRL
ncbi:Uricase [Plasmodiophora brassicae]|uniref:Uricase n=1 Tax=Plasmodiophora brassicae TaxID=37360 RepID=A0A0G4J752_PLABS|nr:hypothetical protein PBRA_003203 [Plasmodiophora brassicae]SPQ95674.1 unnamed protein product [Plasmodiophora brassicae]